MKRCLRCKNEKDLSDFYATKTRAMGGNKLYSSYCKACDIERMGDNKRALREKMVAYKGGKCVRCGYDRCIGALDFHHRDPTVKELHVKLLRSFSEAAKKELDKCDLLCANCHREAHWL